MFSLFCLDNLFLPLQKPVQEQRDTLEPKHLLISFVFAVAVFPRCAQQALHAVFGSVCYPTVLAQYLLRFRACMWVDVLCILNHKLLLKKMKQLITAFFWFVLTIAAQAQATTFTGSPSVKITESGVERSAEKLDRATASSLSCVIKEKDGKFYWETRGNKPLLKIDSNAFVIYLAVDGSGYVRVLKPEFKQAAASISATEKNYDYVEHMLLGLRTVTYYGVAN